MGMFKLYIDYFKSKIKNLRKPKEEIPIDYEEIVEEQWQADFSKPENCRFTAETGDGYTAAFTPPEPAGNNTGGITLEAQRKHLYAWTVNPVFRYKDVIIEAHIRLPEPAKKPDGQDTPTDKAGGFAAGLLFRYISQSTFYALMISDAGWVRLDAVVNSTPMPLLGWIKIPGSAHPDVDHHGSDQSYSDHSNHKEETDIQGAYSIKLIANNTTITILINGHWVACCEDDTIQAAGKIAFAIQNWETYPQVTAQLSRFSLNSIPMAVETAYTEANEFSAVPPDARISLAKTLYAMGRYVPALLQLRAAARLKEPEEADRILAGRIYFAQRMLDEAEQEFQSVLDANPSNEEAFAELGGIYYRAERYEDLQRLLQKVPKPMMAQSSFLSNLEGHLFHALGKHEESAEAYRRAFTINPDQGLFAFHQANELYDCGKKPEAVDAYMQAARAFLQQEAYDDLAEVITILERIAPNDSRTLSIAGKYAYAVGRYDDALLKFKTACKKGSKDSADWYLYGLLLKTDEPKEAVKAFKKACDLEPEYGLYQFRLAEALYLSNGKYQPVLEQALAADSQNGWVHNLRALAALSENDIEQAEAAVAEARRLLPDEVSLLVNYLEVQRRKGQLAKCLPLFDIENGTADLAVERNRAAAFHALANAFADDDAREEAQQWYYKALKLDPKNPELLTDKAENDYALFLLNEADDGLVKALDIQPSVRIYQLIASISVQKGDYARAEVTLRTGLESFAESSDLHYDLACVYRNTKRFEQAQAQVVQLKRYETSERVDALEQALLQDTGTTAQAATNKEETSTAEPAASAKKKKAASATDTKSTASTKSAVSKKRTAATEPASEPKAEQKPKKTATAKKTSRASKSAADAEEPVSSTKTKKRASAKSAAGEEGADATKPASGTKAKKAASAKSAADAKAPPRAKSAVSKKRVAATEPAAEETTDTKTEKAAVKKPRTKKTAE